jgi:hypothetical protein
VDAVSSALRGRADRVWYRARPGLSGAGNAACYNLLRAGGLGGRAQPQVVIIGIARSNHSLCLS